MKIISHCNHCDEKYELDFELIWRKAKCRNCSEEFIITETQETWEKIVEVPEKKEIEKSPDMIIKPHKMSFLLLNTGFIFFILWWVFSLFINIFIAWILFLLAWIVFGLQTIVYKKSLYTLTDRKLIYKTGSLISDNTVEVNLDKITLVRSRLGFIQNKLFWTGNLYVKTAGSSSSKINFIHIEKTLEIYEELQLRMKKNGFSLKKDKLVQTAKPHILGVLWEMWGKVLWVVAVLGYYVIMAAVTFENQWTWSFIGITLFFIILLATVPFVLSYLDLKNRRYDVFTDSIFYTEGFLNKNYSFIPMENISDTENEQSFLSKILGLHDVVISSQWASNKVLFKNMVGGQKMMESIKYLKDKTIMGTKDIINGEVKTESLIWFKDTIEEPLDYDKDFTGEFKMNIAKSMASIIFTIIVLSPLLFIEGEAVFVILVVILPAVIKIGISIFSTKFVVTPSSIEYKYDFFSHKHNSFSVEKITKVTVVESLIDKIFGTCSVYFYSIGSSSAITFKNIKKTENICNKLLAKVWVYLEEDIQQIPTHFSLIEFIKAHVFAAVLFALILLWTIIGWAMQAEIFIITGIIIIAIALIFIYLKFYYSKKFYKNNLHTHFIESKKWIVIQKTDYALFRHIKTTHALKNMFTAIWNISLNVSWEQKVEAKWKNNVNLTSVFTSNSISIKYVKNALFVVSKFDSIYLNREVDTTEILSSKPVVKNSIFFTVIVLVLLLILSISLFNYTSSEYYNSDPIGSFRWVLATIFFMPIAILSIIIGIIAWNIKVMKYSFQKDRVVYSSGIFYKKILSIPYIRFNFIENDTWFVNKIFGNWNVWIFTIWSGKKELNIKNINNYSEVYNLLKKD